VPPSPDEQGTRIWDQVQPVAEGGGWQAAVVCCQSHREAQDLPSFHRNMGSFLQHLRGAGWEFILKHHLFNKCSL